MSDFDVSQKINIAIIISKLNMNCNKEDRIIISPDTTEILPEQFSGNNNVKVVVVPYGVKSIGDDAFSNCSSLEKIILPESLTHIGSAAFSGCSSLKSIELPAGVT